MIQAYLQRFCVQPLDDFEPAPTPEARREMRKALIASLRKDLDLLEEHGFYIVGFNANIIEEKK